MFSLQALKFKIYNIRIFKPLEMNKKHRWLVKYTAEVVLILK